MYIIVGLGNPGAKYSVTRHNVGFMAIQRLAEQYNISLNKTRMKALYGEGIIGGEKVVLAMPQTFMNLSGESVVELMNWYKVDIANLIVIYDDIDIAPGKLRIREKGSGGSHNGMKNIIYLLGKDTFPRIRIGIGGKPSFMDLADYVLAKIRPDEGETLQIGVENATKAVEEAMKNGIMKAMNKYNA